MINRRNFLKIGGVGLTALTGLVRLQAFSSSGNVDIADEKLRKLLGEIVPFGKEDYLQRLNKAYRLLAENKLTALFVEPGATMQYFTGVNWWRSERTFGFLLFPDRLPVWICSAFELDRARELISAEQEIRTWEENESPYILIGKTVRDYGRGHRLAVEPSTRSFIIYGLKKEASYLELVDGSAVSDGCRAVKSEKEIRCLEAANRITKIAYREAFKKIREGMTPEELAGFIRDEHSRLGVSGSGGPSFGPASSFPHGSRQRKSLAPGDVILVDGGCKVEGYSSDVTRTIVFGKADEEQERIWEVVRKAQKAALEACRPGVTCEEIDRAARKVIEEAGYGPGYKFFSHRLGHGIGLEGHEFPYLVQGNKLKIQPGMTFSNEPGIYLPGKYGFRTEDCMVVEEDGARFLGGMEALSIEEPFASD